MIYLFVVSFWLVSVLGWAGEAQFIDGKWIGDPRVDICPQGESCIAVERSYQCYYRMQAAMRAVEPYLQQSTDIRSVQPIYKSPSTQLRDAADAVEVEDVAVEQFRATMRDCVEETK